MWNFFRHIITPAAIRDGVAAARRHPSNLIERRKLSRPIPTGEVEEGSDDSDWARWEDSVSFQDSQNPEMLSGLRFDQPEQAAETDCEPFDPFATVTRNDR